MSIESTTIDMNVEENSQTDVIMLTVLRQETKGRLGSEGENIHKEQVLTYSAPVEPNMAGLYKLGWKTVGTNELAELSTCISTIFENHSVDWDSSTQGATAEFREQLITAGSRLASLVLTEDAQSYLENKLLAKEQTHDTVPVFAIYTNVWEIPWELLFLGNVTDRHGFACELAAVVRCDIEQRFEPNAAEVPIKGYQPNNRLVFVGGEGWPCEPNQPGCCRDPVACKKKWSEIADTVVDVIEGKTQFAQLGAEGTVFQVVAHADTNGSIKLTKNVEYSANDVKAFPLAGPLVCLHSCNVALDHQGSSCALPLTIHRKSKSAVYASMMHLPRCAGCRMAFTIAEAMRDGNGSYTWLDLQKELKKPGITPFWRGYLFVGDYLAKL